MAFSVNNVQTAAASATLSYTPASVSDAVLCVSIVTEDVGDNEPITAINFGGTPLTLGDIAHSVAATNANDTVLAYLVNPGTSALTITVTGGQVDRMGIVAFTLGGVSQSTPLNVQDTDVSNASAASSMSTSATTTLDNCLVISSRNHSIGTALSPTGCTEVAQQIIATTVTQAVGQSTQAVAGTYTHTWASGSAQIRSGISSIAFNEASTAATSLTTTTITTEADLVTGGFTITQTLTGDTYIAAGASFDAQRQSFIDGLVSAQSETNGWNAKRSLIAVTDVARTSDTAVRITLPALTGYDITTAETITHTIPASILTGGVAIVASPAIEITAAAALTLLPTPIESTEAFGTATVKVGGLIEPTPIETTLVFPTMTVSPEELLSIQPTPIESTVTFGGYTLALHPAIGPTPIESTVVFPTLTLKTGQLIEWLAIASTADVASPTVEFGQRIIALNPIYSTSNVPSPTMLGGELMLTSSIFKGSLFAGSLRAGMAASGTYPM